MKKAIVFCGLCLLASCGGSGNVTGSAATALASATLPALLPAPSSGVVKVLQTPVGQLFCKDASGLVFALANAEASKVAGTVGSVAVIATNASKDYVDKACAQASAVAVAAPTDDNASVPVKSVTVPSS